MNNTTVLIDAILFLYCDHRSVLFSLPQTH